MNGGCFGCVQRLIDEAERKKQKESEAQELANKTGEWYGIYIDEFGNDQVAKYTPGQFIFKNIVSPKYSNNTV